MDWTEKIEKAMKDLSNACKENDSREECYKCPFYQYCGGYPDEWFDDDEE